MTNGNLSKGNKKEKTSTLTQNKVVAFFIGGAGDKKKYYSYGPTYIVRDNVFIPFNETLKKAIGKKLFSNNYSPYYLDYGEANRATDIENLIKLIPNKETSLYIIGHSLGAWNGAHLSKFLSDEKYNVKMLITLDPVGEGKIVAFGSGIHFSVPKPQSDFWINVRATPTEKRIDDKVADFGKRWDTNSLLSDINHKCNTHHSHVNTLFNEKLVGDKSASDYLLESIIMQIQ